jgi:hypothetical protein
MKERLRIFAASLFTGIPWLVAAGMAAWMAYQTTDPRAAEIGGNVQAYLIAGLVGFAAVAAVMAWLCLSLNRRTWWAWWAVRLSLWLLLALWGTLAVRAFDSPAALMEDPGAIGKDVRLLGLVVLAAINIAFIVMIERSRALFNPGLRLSV